MLKPVGASCNLRCDYCYYLPVAEGYDAPAKRMSMQVLESVLAGYLPGAGEQVTLAWQGGEPTLAGLGWFEHMTTLVEKHRRPTQTVAHCLQTNGTLLDDAWGAFLREHRVLVGLSLDGLAADHDHYRKDPAGRGSHSRVMDGLGVLRRHGVEHNVLVVLNDRNVGRPRAVWERLMGLGVDWVQFIPAVEWVKPQDESDRGDPDAWTTAPFSPTGAAYGRFLCDVFDRWFEKSRHRVSVRMFDAVLGVLVNGQAGECTYAPTCASQLTIEHDGSVYGCDHFVQPEWKLGRVGGGWGCGGEAAAELTVEGRSVAGEGSGGLDSDWMGRLDGSRFARFGARKGDLPSPCRVCEFRGWCRGGCPKHRTARGDLPGPNVLCDGYRAFYQHAGPRLGWLASYLKRGETPPREAPASLRPASAHRPRVKVRRTRKRR
ncbi:MAG: radical SAM protein [Planctomycetota bacterium]